MNNFVAYDLKILFDKELFELSPSSADNRPLYSVPLYMNLGVHCTQLLFFWLPTMSFKFEWAFEMYTNKV